jgi:hypothetical protein
MKYVTRNKYSDHIIGLTDSELICSRETSGYNEQVQKTTI